MTPLCINFCAWWKGHTDLSRYSKYWKRSSCVCVRACLAQFNVSNDETWALWVCDLCVYLKHIAIKIDYVNYRHMKIFHAVEITFHIPPTHHESRWIKNCNFPNICNYIKLKRLTQTALERLLMRVGNVNISSLKGGRRETHTNTLLSIIRFRIINSIRITELYMRINVACAFLKTFFHLNITINKFRIYTAQLTVMKVSSK